MKHGPSSPRFKMMSPRDKFTSPRERVAKMDRHVRCIIPPRVFLGQRWHVVQHIKFPQRLSKTRKRRMQRQRVANRKQLIDVHDKNALGGGDGIRESEGRNGS